MNNPISRSFISYCATALLGGMALSACAAQVDDTGTAVDVTSETLKAPEVPAALAVPEGNVVGFALNAEGAQIYKCQLDAAGAAAWVFQAPEADLFWHHFLVGSHYAGPTWEAIDGSTVVGKKLAAASPTATAIPWLLLQAVSHDGTGVMSGVTYIQRLATTGGLAPSSGCDAGHAGVTEDVAYTATYYFYFAKPTRSI
jgi:hypothetical protein